MRRPYHRWTAAELRRLRDALERERLTLREAAALFPHITPVAVFRRIYRAGLRSSHAPGCGPNPRGA